MDERIIRAKLDSIHARSASIAARIEGWEARTAIHLGPGEYRYDGEWAPVGPVSEWPAGRTLFLRSRAEAPDAPHGSLFLSFDIRLLEGLLSLDGIPHAGIDAEHPRAPIPRSGPLSLEVEFACNPAALHDSLLAREKARIGQTVFTVVDQETESLYYDALFAWEAARAALDGRRKQLLEQAVEKALLAVDPAAPDRDFKDEVRISRGMLSDLTGSIGADPEGGRVFLTGHSHIDTAWLWPLRETVRKCGRTFSTACRLLERYPGYRFTCSQPQQYAYARAHFPAVFEEIRRWVREGRWECAGGMWVEADCNVPSGESLIRQILLGLEFFRGEFGARPRTCWLPDVFGYPASLPGILAGCGIVNFYTNKLHWQARNPFPAHLFRWEGIDGSRVLAHVPRLQEYYNGFPNPAQLRAAWDGFAEKAAYPEVMMPFGHGDGGGGPTEAMLEFAERARAFPGVPACRQGLAEEYFADVEAAGPDLPEWVGELYLETHRGTYTTQSAVKRANRKNELLLREAEIYTSIAAIEGAAGPAAGATGLRDAWERLLLLQFHDILPGSSIAEVYREALEDHARIESAARGARDAARGQLAARETAAEGRDAAGRNAAGRGAALAAFNSLSWDRRDPVAAVVPDIGANLEVAQPDGSFIPAQVTGKADGQARIVFVPTSVPAIGCARFTVRAAAAAHSPLAVEARKIESGSFVVELDADGTISRLFDKRHQREVIPAGRPANRLQLFQDGPEKESAWNVHEIFEKREYPWEPGTSLRVVESGPVRAVVRVTRRWRGSVVEQDMVVWAGFDRIDFVTRADWSARQVLLKAAFPVEVRAERASFEIQFGAVERPTHRNTSWDREKFEVCAHRWMDLSEPGYGVSVLNDSRYGCDVRAGVLRLTLLRGAEWPDPGADAGSHEFTYSLLPHGGGWREAETVRRGWELNVPVTCVPAGASRTRSWFTVDGPAVLEALKAAEDGDGWILRVYEPHGARGRVTVTAPRAFSSVESCSHVEEAGQPVRHRGSAFDFPILPFQVRTFRIRF